MYHLKQTFHIGAGKMRKVSSGLFITMDGVTEEPSDWQETFDAEMGEKLGDYITNTDTIILGRVTYEYWAPYWSTAESDGGFADHINNTQKYVVSSTLDTVAWGDYDTVALIKENVVEAINKLKQLDGKNIGVSGSPTLVQYLMEKEVLDELQLFIHPVVANKGKRLFKEGGALQRFNLVECQPTSSGTIIATYKLRK
jgi:dihydrofolate reductase